MKAAEFPPGTEFCELDDLPLAWLPSGELLSCYGAPEEAPESVFRQVFMGLASGLTEAEFDQLVARAGRNKTAG